MAEYRIFKSWSSKELKARLLALHFLKRNFEALEHEMTVDHGWHHYYSEAVIAREDPGATEYFDRAVVALSNYEFSDGDIVVAHFDPTGPLAGRHILLEIKVMGLHYLCPALVTKTRDEKPAAGRSFGFRYDTLEGHIERGVEWFTLTKNEMGEIRFRIEARWQPGELPNWWSEIGFRLLSGHYQRKWHRAAHERMSLLAHFGTTAPPPVDAQRLTHQGVDVEFVYHTGKLQR